MDGDGQVTPTDLAKLIGYLNGFGATSVPPLGATLPGQGIVNYGKPNYYDVNGDNQVAPNDLTKIISFLNGFGAGEGESAAVSAASTASTTAVASDSFFADLGSADLGTIAPRPTQTSSPADNMSDLIALLAADQSATTTRRRPS